MSAYAFPVGICSLDCSNNNNNNHKNGDDDDDLLKNRLSSTQKAFIGTCSLRVNQRKLTVEQGMIWMERVAH